MARKRKSRNNKNIGHGAISRIGRPHNPFEPRRNRYAQKYLTLALMGGAAFFVLKGCGDSGDVDNDGDGTFYATVQDCIDDGNNSDICAHGWNNAKAAFYADVPKNMTQQNCQSKYENCYYDNVEQSWIPVVSGFLLSRVIRKDRDEPFVYNSGGSSFASRPVWRNTSGDYSWRSGSGKKESYSSGGFTTKKSVNRFSRRLWSFFQRPWALGRLIMLRHNVPVRRDLDRIAADNGFDFHIIDNEIYWDESRAYRFTLRQIEEQIEKPTAELHQMCLEVVDRAVKDEEILTQLAIPPLYWDVIAESWRARDPSLYGRMDFAWCGNAPVKLLEYNADTPTSLYESAYFQWLWLEDARRSGVIPRDADQYNAIQERLISRFSELYSREPFYFCCCQDTDEDRSTVLYLQDCAEQAGQESRFIYIEELGLGVGGVLTDLDDNVIQRAFKLYPLEWMMRDDNGPLLRKRREQWVEPLWKSILSNKGLMPLLWRFFPGHPNLLASWFDGEKPQIAAGESYVRKPIYSREGGNVTIFDGQNNVVDHADGDYADEPMIYQAFQPLPRFGDSYTLIGSWIVDDEACGMGIREDNTLITKDTSRFVPHYIAG